MTISENLAYLRYFGFSLTFWKTVNKLVKISEEKSGRRKNRGFFWSIHQKNNWKIESYLKQVCSESYQKLRNGFYVKPILKDPVTANVEKNHTIWTIWWQGEDHAPPIVRACIDSMRMYSNGHPVVVLDQNNFREYVHIPAVVEDRFIHFMDDVSLLNTCTLNRTKFSNIVRCYLLYHYGGVWSDATVMFSDQIDELFFTEKWNTLGQDNPYYIGSGLWSTFFMSACAGNGLMRFCYDAYIEYWTKKQYFVNYLMFDHLIDIAYKTEYEFQSMIENTQCGNKNV